MKNIFKKIIVSIITLEARIILKKYNPKIVAVTGSVGKTSTKDAIDTIMSEFYVTRKSEKSFNSEIGLPLTILGIKNAWSNPIVWFWNIIKGFAFIIFPFGYPEWLILEIGADRPGDIKSISGWLKTDVAVITRIAEIPVHIEKFSGQREVVKEKSYIINTLKNSGTLILNQDDSSIIKLKDKAKTKVFTFGFESEAMIVASNYHIVYEGEEDSIMPKGIAFKIDYDGSNIPVRLNGVFGKQNVYTALAAFAVGLSQEINILKMVEILREHSGPPGRFKPLHGIKKTLLIDDTYNSSPVALEMAINSFAEIKNPGRKIIVLGDMLELGTHAERAHKKIGQMIPPVCDLLVLVGEKSRFFGEGAETAGMDLKNIITFENSFIAGDYLKNEIKEGDAVLIKGSQGMRMERVVLALATDDERIKGNIVRQDKEWTKR